MPLKNYLTPLKIGCAASGIVIGARLLGLLPFWEWAAYDRFLSWKPDDAPDERIVLISIEESDIQRAKTYPFSDRLWAEFLNKLKTYEPRVIGLDIFRDQPVAPGTEQLKAVFRATPNLIGITKLLAGRVPAPPILAQNNQIGDVSTPLDHDGVVRRTYLYPVSDLKNPDSAIPNLGLKLAEEYLKTEGIESKNSDINSNWLQLGQGHYPHFRPNDGGYINDSTGGYSILINWRKPPQSFASLRFFEVIDGDVPQNFFKDRLAIVGVGGESFNDFHESPFTASTQKAVRGIDLHAQVASQLIGTALGERSLIQFWPEWGEIGWIFAWGTASAVILWRFSSNRLLLSTLVTASGMSLLCLGLSYIALRQDWWLPSVPPVIAIWMASIPTAYGLANHRLKVKNQQLVEAQVQLADLNKNLEQIVQQRTKDLKSAHEQILKTEKLALIQQLMKVLGDDISSSTINLETMLKAVQLIIKDLEEISLETCQQKTEISLLLQAGYEGIKILEDQLLKLTYVLGRYPSLEQIIPFQLVEQHNLEDLIQLTLKNIMEISRKKYPWLGENNPLVYSCRIDLNLPINFTTRRLLICLISYLIENALEALQAKKLQQNYSPILKFWVETEKSSIVFKIEDNGIGMTQEELDKVKDPFVSLSGKLGLGLFYSQKIIEQLEGTWAIKSVPHEFTQAIAKIPLIF